jgi:nucleotide-binding universal stress UspA family protein
MTAIRRILCATDLSEASEPAWHVARQLGRTCQAPLVLLHVMPPLLWPAEGYVDPGAYTRLVEEARGGIRARLEAVVASEGEPPPAVEARLEDGPPAQRILDVAGESGADLVVVGTHGRTGLPRLLLGSVADRVLRQAECPVLTVRAQPSGEPGRPAPWTRILYATDFSPTAEAAWPWVRVLAEATGARVDLLHVTLSPAADPRLPAEALVQMARTLEAEGRVRAERFLERGGLERKRVSIVLGRGIVADQIVHRAADRAADLVVLGTHGWSGLLRWMLGSVAHRVVQTAPCPVLTVGPTSRPLAGQPAERHAGGTADPR